MNAPHNLIRFGFKIRVRNGAVVEKLLILGRDEADARARLMQMYPHSEVLKSWQENPSHSQTATSSKASFEEIIDLINR